MFTSPAILSPVFLFRFRACAALFLLTMSGMAATPALAAKAVYTIAGIKVDVTASNAVTAKQEAVSDGSVRALRALLRRLTRFSDRARLPDVDLQTADIVMDSISYHKARQSATRYIARLDFHFQPRQIRQLLKQHKVRFTDRQAPQIALVPLFASGVLARQTTGQKTPPAPGATLPTDNKSDLESEWTTGFNDLDLTHALTPVRLVPRPQPGTLAGQPGALDLAQLYRQMSARLNTDRIVLAALEPEADNKHLTLVLYGRDYVGVLNFARKIRIYGSQAGENSETATKTALHMAQKMVLKILEGRWKLAQLGVETASTEEVLPWQTNTQTSQPQTGLAARDRMSVTAVFTGLRDWQKLLGTLRGISGLDELKIGTLSPRTADLTMRYPGGAVGLSRELRKHGLLLHNPGDGWVLQSQ